MIKNRVLMVFCAGIAVCWLFELSMLPSRAADEGALSAERELALHKKLDAEIATFSERIEKSPKNISLYSSRGDALFFRGRFKEAVVDYEQMVVLDPAREADHWRKGIAYFYAERYPDAAHQFEIYHLGDDVDRENGIWRFFSQAKASGLAKAREGLLKYKKDDREPFPVLYRLFAGDATSDQILEQISTAKIGAEEREKRLFYAQLYIGLNEAVEGHAESALKHLEQSVTNSWGPKAGYGPNFMWHVGRLHYGLLNAAAKGK